MPYLTRCALLAGALALVAAATPQDACLAAGTEATDQFVSYRVPLRYCLSGLEPSRTYELRVSYPATSPTRFDLRLEVGQMPQSPLPGAAAVRGRVLADTEKLVIATNAAGELYVPVAGGYVPPDQVVLRVAAEPLSASHSEDRTGTRFNLAFDPLHGGIPATALPLIPLAAGAVLIIVAATCFITQSRLSPWVQAAAAAAASAKASKD